MKKVKYIIFRYLTNADFFNIYKPSGAEEKGGGQTYIDFGTGSISIQNWKDFFKNTKSINISKGAIGPRWEFKLYSIGSNKSQVLTIYQRRKQSFSIAAQRLGSNNSNRAWAWHPDYGFPKPEDPQNRHSKPDNLAIYLTCCTDGSVWAGWFQDMSPCQDIITNEIMEVMTSRPKREGHSGIIDLSEYNIYIDEENSSSPFRAMPDIQLQKQGKKKIIKQIHLEEQASTDDLLLQDVELETTNKPRRQKIQLILERNQKAVRNLKRLYNGECQITGTEYTFRKIDGKFYSEAHHLVPLGLQGADSPYNIIIVSPLIHRMLHYAFVEGLDLSKIKEDNTLDIKINNKPFTIRWHPSHAIVVRKQVT